MKSSVFHATVIMMTMSARILVRISILFDKCQDFSMFMLQWCAVIGSFCCVTYFVNVFYVEFR